MVAVATIGLTVVPSLFAQATQQAIQLAKTKPTPQATQFDPPSTNDYIQVTGIDSSGDLVGSYADATDTSYSSTAFILSEGTSTPIPIVTCTGCYASGINSSKIVVGSYVPSGQPGLAFQKGFMCTSPCTGTLTTVDVTNAGEVNPTAINDSGVIVGTWYPATCTSTCGEHGFIHSPANGSVSFDAPPLSATATTSATQPEAINGNGDFAGVYEDSTSAWHIFLFTSKGQFRSFDIPGASGFYPVVTGVNNNDEIVGAYYNSNFTILTGFTISGKKEANIQFSNATNTPAFGVNTAGTIVGEYCTDTSPTLTCLGNGSLPLPGNPSAVPNWQSFFGTPGHLTALTLTGTNLSTPLSVEASVINDTGHIGGTFIDINGYYHGFYQ